MTAPVTRRDTAYTLGDHHKRIRALEATHPGFVPGGARFRGAELTLSEDWTNPSNADNEIPFDTVVIDTDDYFAGGSFVGLTIPPGLEGVYALSLVFTYDTVGTNPTVSIWNDTAGYPLCYDDSATVDATVGTVATSALLREGDVITARSGKTGGTQIVEASSGSFLPARFNLSLLCGAPYPGPEPPTEIEITQIGILQDAGTGATNPGPMNIDGAIPTIQDDDTIIVIHCLRNQASVPVVPAGWTQEVQDDNANGKVTIFSMVYDSGTYTDPTFNWTTASDYGITAVVVRPANLAPAVISIIFQDDPGGDTSIPYPTISTGTVAGGIVWAGALVDIGTAPTIPAGYTSGGVIANFLRLSYLLDAPSPETPGTTTTSVNTTALVFSLYISGTVL